MNSFTIHSYLTVAKSLGLMPLWIHSQSIHIWLYPSPWGWCHYEFIHNPFIFDCIQVPRVDATMNSFIIHSYLTVSKSLGLMPLWIHSQSIHIWLYPSPWGWCHYEFIHNPFIFDCIQVPRVDATMNSFIIHSYLTVSKSLGLMPLWIHSQSIHIWLYPSPWGWCHYEFIHNPFIFDCIQVPRVDATMNSFTIHSYLTVSKSLGLMPLWIHS